MNCVRWLFSRGLEDRLPFLSGPDNDSDALGDGLSDDDGFDYYDVAHNGARTISIRDSIHTLARPLAEREHQLRSERLVATLPSISPYIGDDGDEGCESEDDESERVCAICLDPLFVKGTACDGDEDDSDDDGEDCEDHDEKEFTKCRAHGWHHQQCRHAHTAKTSASSRRRRKEECNATSSQPQTVTKTQCNHVMHRKCLATWLAIEPSLSCPVCRVPVKPAKLSSYSSSSSSSSSSLAKKKSRLLFASSEYAAAPVSSGVRRSRRMAMLDEEQKQAQRQQQHGLEMHPSTASPTSSGAVVRSPTPVPHFYHHHHLHHLQYQDRIAATAGGGSGGAGGGGDRRRRATWAELNGFLICGEEETRRGFVHVVVNARMSMTLLFSGEGHRQGQYEDQLGLGYLVCILGVYYIFSYISDVVDVSARVFLFSIFYPYLRWDVHLDVVRWKCLISFLFIGYVFP